MARAHLTDVTVRALKAEGVFWDNQLPGFGLRIGKKRKTWLVVRGKARTKIVIGHYPQLSLRAAREEARHVLWAPPSLSRVGIRFGDAVAEFVEDNYRTKRLRTQKEAKRLLTKHFGLLNSHDISEVSDVHIQRELSKLRDIPSEQLHAFRAARAFFRWAARPPRRYLIHSPLQGYDAPSHDKKRERVLTDVELRKVWLAATGNIGAIVRLLILTGARKMEIASMRFDWLEGDLLTIPGSFRKNARPLTLPLGPFALSLLPERFSDYVFPGRYDVHAHIHDGSFGKYKHQLDQASGVFNYVLHDLRRTAATFLAAFTPPHIIQAILGHSQGPVSNLQAIYNKYAYLEEKRAALTEWETRVARLVSS